MERILLVEPNYKNKYPPIGLMKISTYFKNKEDFVEFHKGLLPQSEVKAFDKILITTLFTFDFDMCIQTIRYYIAILGIENVYVGGIAATIMPENFKKEIPGLNILTGQLTSSSVFGYTDNVNIDMLELDYDILWDIAYNYPSADSYFIYTTRGCPRKCSFCAVKTLEPNFYDCNNIKDQMENVNARFGIKRRLLIMDNNILYSKNFADTAEELKEIGFGLENNKIKKNNNMRYYLKSLNKRIKLEKKYKELFFRIKKEFLDLKFIRIKKQNIELLNNVIEKIKKNSDKEAVEYILENEKLIVEFFDQYHFHKISRYVDFNQGLDSRLFTKDKARIMSNLAVRPCRIAFDRLEMRNDYFSAMEFAIEYGIKNFSNYLLYNFEDKPEELWTRLNLNVKFCTKHKDKKISLFSFPMKYASISHTDRNYVGEFWNKKFLRAVNVILNVTSGIVAKEEDFFVRAFGRDLNEFIEILTMPDEFIRFRDFFDEKGFIESWKKCYTQLSEEEKKELIPILEKIPDNPDVLEMEYCENISNILTYYSIRKKKVENNLLYYLNLIENLQECKKVI